MFIRLLFLDKYNHRSNTVYFTRESFTLDDLPQSLSVYTFPHVLTLDLYFRKFFSPMFDTIILVVCFEFFGKIENDRG